MSISNGAVMGSVLSEHLSLLDNLPGMVYQCRNAPDWPMLFVSKGSTELCGYSSDALLAGRPSWLDLIHLQDQKAVWQSVQDAVQHKTQFEIVYRLIARDKRCKWVWERGSALNSDEHGVIIEGFVTDITLLREKGIELERAKAYATAIVESADEGVILIDSKFQIESLNKAATRMFGIAGDTEAVKNFSNFVSVADFAILKREVEHFHQSETSDLFNGEWDATGRRIDGLGFPMHLHVRELELEHERRYVALVRDISERSTKELEIQRQNEQLNATITFSPIGIYTADKELRIIGANFALADMLGYREQDLIGRRFTDFTQTDDVDAAEKAVQHSLESGPGHYSARRRFLHKDGHIVHTRVNVAVGHDSKGNPEFVVANVEDLTEHLAAEAKVRDQQDQLARLDRLSTLGEMMTGIAHEINQPLTAISTYAQSGLRFMDPKNPKPGRLKEALSKLSDQARRAGTVVERIRELGRQETSDYQLVRADHLIEQIEDLAVIDAGSRGARIQLDLNGSLPPVWCDPIQIQQVILNLIRNAIDSMEDCKFCNGDEILLRTSIDEDGMTTIAVIDCGTGVSEEVATDLFRPFSTHKRSGLGLGLSISRSIMTAHGGQLDYYNNPTAGATFYLTLSQAPGDSIHES